MAVPLGLMLPTLAGAEEGDDRLRAAAARVAVLTTGWEPDLGAALQGMAAELGPDWQGEAFWDLPESALAADPMLAAWVYMRVGAEASLGFGQMSAGCFRMGRATIVATLDAWRF